MPKTLTINYDTPSHAVIAKVNKVLEGNGVLFMFQENESEQEGVAVFELVGNRAPQTGFYKVLEDFDIMGILGKYGPEGCFILAEELRKVAQEDMDLAKTGERGYCG